MDELLNDFLVETKEGLLELDNKLVQLEKNPDDQDLLGSIFRVMHTIKGTCGFLGLPRLESVAHAGEDVMDALRSGDLTLDSNIVSLILESIDQIKDIIEHIESNGGSEPSGDDQKLILKLRNVIKDGNNNENQDSQDINISFEKNQEEVPKQDIQQEEKSEEAIKIKTKATEQEKSSKPSISSDLPSKKIAQQSIRVNVGVLENLMQVVGELVLNRNQMLQLERSVKDGKFSAPIQRLSHITSELQEGVMKTRMQPISNAWTKFPRMIRDLANDLDKKIELIMKGEETELDRQLIETIKDPLAHMVRNSADHGIEMPEIRKANGKNETGVVELKAYHQGGHIIIEIVDDGGGIDLEVIKNKILSKNLATAEELQLLTKQQILQFIFKAGFSTAEKVTSISGRGVGMDVVKKNIEKISGTVELDSEFGKGSKFLIKIPLTLAIIQILIVKVRGEKFGIPQINVLEICRCGDNLDHHIEDINGKKLLRIRNSLVPLLDLANVLDLDSDKEISKDSKFVVICEISGETFGIIVDDIFDTEEIVVKPVAPLIKELELYSGNTILGDGSIILIIDPVGLSKYISNITSKDDKKLLSNQGQQEVSFSNKSSFLILRVSENQHKVVPLEIVSRIEEIDVSRIEQVNGKKVVQYRNDFIYLYPLGENYKYPKEGVIEIVVFNNQNNMLGLVVNEVVDIVEEEICSENYQKAMAVVIKGRTMDLVDISAIFNELFPAEFKKEPIEKSNVLFIDDSSFFRKFIPPSLKSSGYNVCTVNDGKEAIKKLEENKNFDFIITDLNMPNVNGEGLVDFCKADQDLATIPIIVLTSTEVESFKDNILKKGVLACVAKTNHRELINIMNEYHHGHSNGF